MTDCPQSVKDKVVDSIPRNVKTRDDAEKKQKSRTIKENSNNKTNTSMAGFLWHELKLTTRQQGNQKIILKLTRSSPQW